MTDIGTGSYTILAQVAADALDVPFELDGLRLVVARTRGGCSPGSPVRSPSAAKKSRFNLP
jgi:CO/xanthine dehydrogenase Mo-binding subunit